MAEKISGGSIFGGKVDEMANGINKLNGQTIKGKVEIEEGEKTKKTIKDISQLTGDISTLSETHKVNVDSSKLTEEQKSIKAIAQAWLDIDKAAKQYAKAKIGNGSFDKTKEEVNSLVQSLETLSNAKVALPLGGKELFGEFISDKVASDQKKNVDSIISSMHELKRVYEKDTRKNYKADLQLISDEEAKQTTQAFEQQADAAKKAGEQTGKAMADGVKKSADANKEAAAQAEKTAESYKKEAQEASKAGDSVKQTGQKVQEVGVIAEERVGVKEFEKMVHVSDELKKELGGVYDVFLQIKKETKKTKDGVEEVYDVAYKLTGKNGTTTWIGLNNGLLSKGMKLSSAATDAKKAESIRDNLLLKEQLNLYKELNKVRMKMAQNPGKAMTEELQRQEQLIKNQMADVNVTMARLSSQEIREKGIRNLLAEKVKFQREYDALIGERNAKADDQQVKQLEKDMQNQRKEIDNALKQTEINRQKQNDLWNKKQEEAIASAFNKKQERLWKERQQQPLFDSKATGRLNGLINYREQLKNLGLLSDDVEKRIENLWNELNKSTVSSGFKMYDSEFKNLRDEMSSAVKDAKAYKSEQDKIRQTNVNDILKENVKLYEQLWDRKVKMVSESDETELNIMRQKNEEVRKQINSNVELLKLMGEEDARQQDIMNRMKIANQGLKNVGYAKQGFASQQQQLDMQRITNGDKNYINELWGEIDRQYQERIEAEKQQEQRDKEYQTELQGVLDEQYQEEINRRKQQEKQDKEYLDEISGVMETQRQAELAKRKAEADRIAKADQAYNADLNAVLGEQQAKKEQMAKAAKAGDKLFSDAQVKQMQEVVNKTKELWELRKSMVKAGSDAELQALIEQDERLAHTVALESERLKLFGDERAVMLAEAKALEIQEKAIAAINGGTSNQTRINNLLGSANKFQLGTQGMTGLYEGIDPLLSNLDTSLQKIKNLKAISDQIINLPWQERVAAEKYLNEEYANEKKNLDEIKAKINGIKRDPSKKYVDETTISKQIATMEDFYSKNDGASKRMRDALRGVIDETQKLAAAGRALPKDFDPLVVEFNKIKTEMKKTGDTGMSIASKLGRAWKSQMASQIAMYTSFYSLIRYAKNAFNTIRELDTAMVDLRKTTTMSASELNDFYFEANESAKKLGVTTQELIQQAADWSRLNNIGPLYSNV